MKGIQLSDWYQENEENRPVFTNSYTGTSVHQWIHIGYINPLKPSGFFTYHKV